MPYRVCKTLDVESGHMLSKHSSKCRYPHGHTRRVEFTLEANELDRNDMVCDFKVVEQIIGDYLETLDHAICVNTADPAYGELHALYGDRIVAFEEEDPTTEVMARVIFHVFATKLAELRRAARILATFLERNVRLSLCQGLGNSLFVGGIFACRARLHIRARQ